MTLVWRRPSSKWKPNYENWYNAFVVMSVHVTMVHFFFFKPLYGWIIWYFNNRAVFFVFVTLKYFTKQLEILLKTKFFIIIIICDKKDSLLCTYMSFPQVEIESHWHRSDFALNHLQITFFYVISSWNNNWCHKIIHKNLTPVEMPICRREYLVKRKKT